MTPFVDACGMNDTRSGDKITLRLSTEARAALEWISAKYGNLSLAKVIRKALSTEKCFEEQGAKGSAILIEDAAGRQREIVFR